MSNDTHENPLLRRAIKHVLKPLVRFFIKKQITLPTLVELVKSAYVEVAEKDFAIDGKAPTDSRINLITGVHRKDVKRLRDLNDEHKPSERLSINSLMLATWMAEAPYAQKGEPQDLPIQGDVSFESLANLYSRQNIRASSILANWRDLGWVVDTEDGALRLNLDELQSHQLSEDQLYFFAENLADHMATSTGNLASQRKQFERAVFYNRLTESSIKKLRASSKEKAMTVLKALNQEALTMQKQDKQLDDANYRFRLGSYFYTDLDDE